MEETELALGLINKFKQVKNPGQPELITIPLIFGKLHKPLKKYFKTISYNHVGGIKCEYLKINGYSTYSQHYLVVIGSLSRVLGISIYMTETLEAGVIVPVKRLYIIGQKTEVSIGFYICKYLYTNEKALEERLSKDRPKGINPNFWNKKLRLKFYIPIFNELQKLQNLKTKTLNPKLHQLKNKFIIDYLIKRFIFDFNDKDKNPLYNEHDNTILDKFKVPDGKWVNKGLLWARDLKM